MKLVVTGTICSVKNSIMYIQRKILAIYFEKNRCLGVENNKGASIKTEESNDNQRDDRFSRGYKLEGTNISSLMNEIEDCGDGYFLDEKSDRCIGNYFLFLHRIIFCNLWKFG